jgi:hypothetical protein
VVCDSLDPDGVAASVGFRLGPDVSGFGLVLTLSPFNEYTGAVDGFPGTIACGGPDGVRAGG